MKKRVLGTLLALTLILGLIPVQVFAEETVPEGTVTQSAEIPEETPAASDESEIPEENPTSQETEDLSETILSEETLAQEAAALAGATAEEDPEDPEETAERTILLYLCGTDLETRAGLASFNLRQVLSSSFSAGEKIRFLVMTGGAQQWQLESSYLCDPNADAENQPAEISHVYNQIWEAKGLDAAENPGKLELLDGDGILGDGESAKRAEPVFVTEESEEGFTYEKPVGEPEDYEWMSDPEVLKAFINYGVENFPAEKYDLILWDHGGGPLTGFVSDMHTFSKGLESLDSNDDCLTLSKLIDIMQDNLVTADGGRFDFIDFDACLMNSVEIDLAFMDYTDYYIASPETEPGYGQEYSGWLNLLGQNTEIGTYELAKKLVDDFYLFYEEGEGQGQDGTLAVIDMAKLRDSGFIEKLSELLSILQAQTDRNLYYDEISSAMRSIQYGGMSYYDLGNFLSMLGISIKELGKNEPAGVPADMEENEYTKTCAELLQILSDESVIYGKGTDGIRTQDSFFYRTADGSLKYSDSYFTPLGTSGIYLYFPTISSPTSPTGYHREIQKALALMPEDGRKDFLSQYSDLMLQYALISSVGHTVTYMANHMEELGLHSSNEITYDSVMAFWKEKSIGEFYEDSDWERAIAPLLSELNALSGDEPSESIKGWLSDMIAQQAKEVVLKDNVRSWTVKYPDHQNSRIEINHTKKRVIEDVRVNINAKLPVLEQYLEDHELLELLTYFPDLAAFTIGTSVGSEDFDLNLSLDSIEDYIRWLDKDSSTWEVSVPEPQWFALRDANGVNHVVNAEQDENEILVVTTRKEKVYDEEQDRMVDADRYVYLRFTPEGTLTELMMQNETGSYRPILPKDLTGELELTPVDPISLLGLVVIPAAISSPFTLSAENADSIGCFLTDVSEIPDIDDLRFEYVLTDMYGSEINISETVANPLGELYHISFAEASPAVYNGKEQSPVITVNGKKLTEGRDYELIKESEDTVMKEPGTYFIALQGLGEYVGLSLLSFQILPANEEPGGNVQPVQPATDKKPVKSPATGDPNSSMLWIVLMILSGFAAAGGIAISRKK